MSAGYATPRATLGMTDAHIEKFKSDLSVHLPETVREEVAKSYYEAERHAQQLLESMAQSKKLQEEERLT